jgi:hypothetical protein
LVLTLFSENSMKRKFLSSLLFLSAFLSASFLSAFTSNDYTNAGLQVYAKKDYALAIRYFSAALGMNPSDARALQSRANCYYFLGKYEEALGDYEKVLAANPSGPVSQFVQALRAKTAQTVPSLGAAAPITQPQAGSEAVKAQAPQKPAGLGFRLEPAYCLVTLNDFTADAGTGLLDAAQIQGSNPTYKFSESVPTGFVNVGMEPVVHIGSSFELGLPFCIMPVGNVTSSSSDNNGFNNSIAYSISAFSFGLNARLLLGSGPFRAFVSGGGLMAPIGISYTNILNTTGNPTLSGSGDFSGSAVGAQGQLGLDIHVGEPFVVSLFGGYQSASANSFKGTVTVSGNGSTTTDAGQLGVFDDVNGKKVTFLKDGDPAPLNFRPLQIDLSGILAGIHLAIFF